MALYCAGSAGYLRALPSWHTPDWSGKAIGIGLIVAVVVVNLIGTSSSADLRSSLSLSNWRSSRFS